MLGYIGDVCDPDRLCRTQATFSLYRLSHDIAGRFRSIARRSNPDSGVQERYEPALLNRICDRPWL
jgi:hypothetical protein